MRRDFVRLRQVRPLEEGAGPVVGFDKRPTTIRLAFHVLETFSLEVLAAFDQDAINQDLASLAFC